MAKRGGGETSAETTMELEESAAPKRSRRDIEKAKVNPSGTAQSSETILPPQADKYNSGNLSFVHKRIICTRGTTFKTIKSKLPASATVPALNQYLVTTPYAQVPVHFIPWYLSQGEFDSLPRGVYIEKVRCVLTPLGYRTPFLAGSASLSYCNADNIVIRCNAMGLNNKFHGWNFDYTFSAETPMVVSSLQNNQFFNYKIWGEHAQDKEMTYYPPTIGNVYELERYYTMSYEGLTATETYYSLPEIFQNINTFHLSNSNKNDPVIYEYRPMKNILTAGRIYPPLRNKSVQYMGGAKISGKYEFSGYHTGGKLGSLASSTKSQKTYVPVYNSTVEQSGSISNGLFEEGGACSQPTLHIGVLPVHAFSNSSTDDTYQPIYSYWSCVTECVVKYSYGLNHMQILCILILTYTAVMIILLTLI